jgi:hypothetical protein
MAVWWCSMIQPGRFTLRSLPNNTVAPITFDEEGTAWIATWGGGFLPVPKSEPPHSPQVAAGTMCCKLGVLFGGQGAYSADERLGE